MSADAGYRAPYRCPTCGETYYVGPDDESAGCDCGFRMPPIMFGEAIARVREKNEKLGKAVGPQPQKANQ